MVKQFYKWLKKHGDEFVWQTDNQKNNNFLSINTNLAALDAICCILDADSLHYLVAFSKVNNPVIMIIIMITAPCLCNLVTQVNSMFINPVLLRPVWFCWTTCSPTACSEWTEARAMTDRLLDSLSHFRWQLQGAQQVVFTQVENRWGVSQQNEDECQEALCAAGWLHFVGFTVCVIE